MNQEYQQAISRFIQDIEIRNEKSSTASHYKNDLEQFGRMIDKAPRAVTRLEISQFVTEQLKAGLSAATVNRRLASLSSFFEYLADEAEDEAWTNPVVWRSHRVKQGHQLPRDLSEQIAGQFWATVQLGPERDQAIVALMLDVGLRVGEVARLQLSDFEASQQPSELSSLRVTGKGQRQRRVWLVPETSQLLQAWLSQRPAVQNGALFITRRKRGFSVRGLQERVKHYTLQAGLPADAVSCHRLRHTFARRMAEARMPLPSLSHWLGHRQLKTTQIYIAGANPQVQADYQAAMALFPAPAERLHQPLARSDTPQSEPTSATNRKLELTGPEIRLKIADLPDWLQTELVDFIETKQLHWQLHYRRRRSQQWLGELQRAFGWLLEQRSLTSLSQLQRADLKAYLLHLQTCQLSSYTINHFLTTFWAFLHFVEERGGQIGPALFRLPRPKKPDWQPRPLGEAQFRQLEQHLAQADALQQSWFFILADGGLRVGELEQLTVADWDPNTQTLHIRFGKGGLARRVPLTDRASQAIAAHLAQRPQLQPQQPLLAYRSHPLSASAIRKRLHRWAALLDIEHLTPHRLRHTYATRLLNTGKMPITTLKKLMGHRHLDTTMRYAEVYDRTLQTDYTVAMASLVPELDRNLWQQTLEDAFEPNPIEFSTSQPNMLISTANCM